MRLFYTIIPLVCLMGNVAFSQNNDCTSAVVICSSSQISYNPAGPGFNDFSIAGNDNGCLNGNEHQSAWYYFAFQPDMPPNSILEFIISPNAGAGEDYDFAIYGPDPNCSELGEPIRCSFANGFCFYCPFTGLGNGADDFSESPSGDGFVAPLVVQPGEGYYLLVDNYDSSSAGFDLTWGGGAAAYLDCTATPECNIELTQTGPLELCPSPQEIDMPVSVSGTEGNTVYAWTATNGGAAYLSATNIANPDITIPSDATGSYTYTLTVTDEICSQEIDVIVNIAPPMQVTISGTTSACEGEEITLSVSEEYTSYQWSSGASNSSITVTQAGNYSVQVTDNSGCSGSQSTDIVFHPLPEPLITGEEKICEGATGYFDAGPGFFNYQWSNGPGQQTITPSTSGIYEVTVTDLNGCEGTDDILLEVLPLPVVTINGDDLLCKGESTTLAANSGMASYQWNTGAETALISISDGGLYEVLVTDINGCSNSGNFSVEVSDIQLEYTTQDPSCFGDSNGFIRIDDVKGGFSPYQFSWDGGVHGTNEMLAALSSGMYNLNVLDKEGCEYELDININEGFDLMSYLGEDQNVRLGDEVELEALLNIPEDEIASLIWLPEDIINCINCLEYEFIPLQTTMVHLMVEDIRGCKTEQEIMIFVEKDREVFIPNAFSPNDDGVNDILMIFAGKDVSHIKNFQIYNRWGSPVFEVSDFYPNDPAYGWDGSTKSAMNSGTYIYSADVEFIDGSTKMFMGDFVLLR